ncbi:MAG: putative FlaG/YvyC family protein [Alphaproteobacteria bacterium]|jgi:uncharacterized FlaG/YvyC family protein
MANLDPIGNSHLTGSPRGDETPVVRAQAPESPQPVEKGERAEKRSQAERVELPSRAYSARLNYDQDSEEVIIEILDPQTGDVLQRFPAEKLPDDIRALVSDPGSLVKTFA